MNILSGNILNLDLSNQDQISQHIKNLNKELAEKSNNPSINAKEIAIYKQLAINLLKISKDLEKENLLLITCCIMDMLRIVAPVEILTPSSIKKTFSLISESCKFLEYPENQTYPQILHILRILVDISASTLVIKSNQTNCLLKVTESMLEYVQSNCGHTAEHVIAENIRIILEELNEITEAIINPILLALATKNKKKPKFRICMIVLQKAHGSVKEFISTYLHELFFTNKHHASSKLLQTDKYSIAYEIYKINHDYLISILCGISELFFAKDSEEIIIMIGKIASCKKSGLFLSNSYLFQEFLKLYDSIHENIRATVIEFISKFFKNHLDNEKLLKGFKEIILNRLRDSSATIRKNIVVQICKSSVHKNLSKSIIEKLCERIRDTKPTVRKKAIQGLANIFYIKCVDRAIFSGSIEEKYFIIIEEILKCIKGSNSDEQLDIINALEEIVLPLNLYSKQRVKGLEFIFNSLSDFGKQAMKIVLRSKSFWGDAMVKVLDDNINFEESCSIFSGNIKEPLQHLLIKASKKEKSAGISSLLSMPETKSLISQLCGLTDYSEKCRIYKELTEIVKKCSTNVQEALYRLKNRCFNFFISSDQIQYISSNLPLLSIIGYSCPSLLTAHIDDIIDKSLESSEK